MDQGVDPLNEANDNIAVVDVSGASTATTELVNISSSASTSFAQSGVSAGTFSRSCQRRLATCF